MRIISLSAILLLMAAYASAVPVLDATKQLFLDDGIIAEQQNTVRTIHPAQKFDGNPVLRPTESWEHKNALIYGSVVKDGDGFRMWYHGGQGVSYAESSDGITWQKPLLGLHQVDGQDTNLLMKRGVTEEAPNFLLHQYEIFGVHENPVSNDPDKRWVMGYLSIHKQYEGPREDPYHRTQRRGLGVAYSADGYHWTLGEAFSTDAICDGATHWMWEADKTRFVLYGRTKFKPPEVMEAWKDDPWTQKHYWGRAVARVESPDFLDWNFKDPATAPVVMTPDIQDRPSTEIYSMLVFPYESVYIALIQMFHNQEDTGQLDIQLAVSRDSINFERIGDRSSFLPCGPIGSWDRFNNSLANNPPLEIDDELRFYYGGRTYRHGPYDGEDKGEIGGAIGFASIPKDRFVSLDGSYNGAFIKTVPFDLNGSTLHLNTISAFGAVVVEVLNEAGDVLATSKPVTADTLDATVQWEHGALANLSDPIVLKFNLSNAQLFSFWVTQ